MATIAMRCNCAHDFQDKELGRGMRLHNIMPSGKARCTVCATVRDIPGFKKQAEKPSKN